MATPPAWIIYQLLDPRTGETRYIGKTGYGSSRAWSHSHKMKGDSGRYGRWKRLLLSVGLRPVFEVIGAQDTEDESLAAEEWAIAVARWLGCDLVNTATGGRGPTGMRHTAKARARMSVAVLRTRRDAGTAKRTSEGRRMFSEDLERVAAWREKLCAASRRRWADKDARRRQSDAIRSAWAESGRVGSKGRRPIIDGSGTTFGSQVEASRALGISVSEISRVLRGRATSTSGHVFRYATDPYAEGRT